MQRHAIASTVYTGSIGQVPVCYDKQLDHSGGQNARTPSSATNKRKNTTEKTERDHILQFGITTYGHTASH